ncbi:MAG: c-type cytochrome [Nevskiaceae bacterium]
MKTHLRFLAAGAVLLAAAPAAAGDAATPAQVTVCAACHGADGKATLPMYPHLAGQYASYLEQALREYRSGARKNLVMGPQSATLTDADIRQLAAYYAAQAGPLHTPDVHAASPKAAAR